MSDIADESYEAGTYFLEIMNNPTGILISRVIIIGVILVMIGFYVYVKMEHRRKNK